jgi:hypothetical protein
MVETTCPRCGATLRDEDAAWLAGPPGYAPALFWVHPRPDGRGKCRLWAGPPIAMHYLECGSIMPDALSAGRESPGSTPCNASGIASHTSEGNRGKHDG